MTLLIGTVSKSHIVITADGLSLVNPTSGAGIPSDAFRKIYPVPGIPVAFAHHGFNILKDKPIREFIEDYLRHIGAIISTASVKGIAEDLRSYTAQAAESVLSDPTNKGVIGFWIAGFSPSKRNPELYEVCWPYSPDPRRLQTVVLGGDAKHFIEAYLDRPLGPFRRDRIGQSSVDVVRRYHQTLYNQAKDRQDETGQRMFGGHQHQLVLKKSRWEWTVPPK
jgi:hypothetical protein